MSWNVEMKGWDEARARLPRIIKELKGPIVAKALMAAALEAEAQVKIDITEKGLVDTGFMRSSVYASGSQESTYGTSRSEAIMRNPDAPFGHELSPHKDSEAFLVVGAEYAPYVEVNQPFLRPTLVRAGDDLAQVMAGVIMDEIEKIL